MDPVKCLIVDDEPLARELLVGFCGHLPALEVAGVCGNALDAKKQLQEQKIDLIFLDINMPVLDGLGFLNTLTNPPVVIIITAYKEYAVNAFDMAVCDYLVKPFSLERFIIAVDRATARLGAVKTVSANEIPGDDYIFFKTDGKIYKIDLSSFLFAEASGNHSKLITTEQTLTLPMPFSSLENLLRADRVIKVHRSFLINKAKIARIEGNRVFIYQHEIPIGKHYKEDFFNKLKL